MNHLLEMVCSQKSIPTSILSHLLLLLHHLVTLSTSHNTFYSPVGGKERLNMNMSMEAHVLGAFPELLNSTLFYQSYTPLIYKFPLPPWKSEDLRLNKSLTCQNDESSSENYLCPIVSHLEALLTPVAQTMRFYRNVVTASSGDFFEHNFSCDKIRPHFLHFSTLLGGLGPYLSEFRSRCSMSKNVSIGVKTVVAGAPQHALAAYEKFKALHEDSKEKKSSEWKFLQMTGYIALQNSYALSQYVDSVRWANAFSSCQSFRLDVGLVSPAMLNESLTELSKNLYANGYNFSLPFLGSLPHYYKVPLVDCILTQNVSTAVESDSENYLKNTTANLIIRLLVPIVKMGVSHKLIKLNKVPYFRTERGEGKICEIRNFQSDDAFLIEETESTGGIVVIGRASPYCGLSRLCKVPEISQRHVSDPCVLGIITKNQSLTAEFCIFECTTIPNYMTREKVLPIFSQLTPNSYAITGLVPMGPTLLLVQCVGAGQSSYAVMPNSTEGVILTTLPCNCSLVYGGKRFTAQPPCEHDLLSVEHIIEMGNSHRDAGAGHLRTTDEFIDYLIEAMDPHNYNITFSETSKDMEHSNSSTNNNADNADNVKESASQSSLGPSHCGHVLLWISLISLLILNLTTLLVLYKNGIISFSALFFGRGNNNIERLNNDIPISNFGNSNNGFQNL